MRELLNILESPHNYLYSFFICVSIGVWLISLLGFVKDFNLGGDDISINTDGDIGSFGEWLGFGTIPTSVLITLLLFFNGVFGIILNEILLDKEKSWWILVVNFIFSFSLATVITSFIKKPLKYLFSDYGVAYKSETLVGKIAIVSSGQVTEQFGQADVTLENGTNITIAIRRTEPSNIFSYGQKVLLTYFDADKNIYWCEKFD
ncbi:MAG: YqiJ family protein [Raineya sp.]|jgi:hypothetical protein|nr:YqiJ family protein [Raineya sp.]